MLRLPKSSSTYKAFGKSFYEFWSNNGHHHGIEEPRWIGNATSVDIIIYNEHRVIAPSSSCIPWQSGRRAFHHYTIVFVSWFEKRPRPTSTLPLSSSTVIYTSYQTVFEWQDAVLSMANQSPHVVGYEGLVIQPTHNTVCGCNIIRSKVRTFFYFIFSSSYWDSGKWAFWQALSSFHQPIPLPLHFQIAYTTLQAFNLLLIPLLSSLAVVVACLALGIAQSASFSRFSLSLTSPYYIQALFAVAQAYLRQCADISIVGCWAQRIIVVG